MAQQFGKSTAHYRKNRKSLLIKRKYQREYNKKPGEVARRVELQRINRRQGTDGNGDRLDVSHKKRGGTFNEREKDNRARNRGKA